MNYQRNGGYPLSGKEKIDAARIISRAEDLLEQLDVFTVVVGSAAINLENQDVQDFFETLGYACSDIRNGIERLRREEKGKAL